MAVVMGRMLQKLRVDKTVVGQSTSSHLRHGPPCRTRQDNNAFHRSFPLFLSQVL
jgi:hypothetical protein